MVRISVSPAENVDSALLLTAAPILLRIRVLQLGSEQQHAVALERLPVLRLRNFVRETPDQRNAGTRCGLVLELGQVGQCERRCLHPRRTPASGDAKAARVAASEKAR